jgi:hypothetical protein
MENKPKLTLIGDSWIYGTWRKDDGTVVPDQPGMSRLLSDRYDVTLHHPDAHTENFRNGIWSELLLASKVELAGTVIVFQGNTANTLHAHAFDFRHDELITTSANLEDLFSRIVDSWYAELNKIAAAAGITIYVAGGATDIDQAALSRYNNLANICTSWIQMMIPDHVPTPVMLGSVRDSFRDLELSLQRLGRDDMVEQLLLLTDPFKRAQLISSGAFTSLVDRPGLWPSLTAHDKMAEHILNYFS